MKLTFTFTDTPDLAALSKYDIYKTHFDFPDEALQLPDCEDRLLTIAQQVGELTQACLHVTCKEVGWRNKLIMIRDETNRKDKPMKLHETFHYTYLEFDLWHERKRRKLKIYGSYWKLFSPQNREKKILLADRPQLMKSDGTILPRKTLLERFPYDVQAVALFEVLADSILGLINANDGQWVFYSFCASAHDKSFTNMKKRMLKERAKSIRSAQKKSKKAESKKQRTGQIYFIQQGDDGAIKIGYSTNPEKRLKSLQTGSAYPLKMLLTIEGSEDQEKALHDQFAAYQLQGEWFRPVDALLAAIRELESS